ncbi:hypothetical protein GJ744_001244 [Endocarpon pusillum]|uniref:Uncharacterized protein n=1 Tax=Endocarpon pusillum TaxID=364733 RepID=A0A8H7DZL0_9EURO|nr:hypothetical protein GJ744_001244 [Endocarpon pusillum]
MHDSTQNDGPALPTDVRTVREENGTNITISAYAGSPKTGAHSNCDGDLASGREFYPKFEQFLGRASQESRHCASDDRPIWTQKASP